MFEQGDDTPGYAEPSTLQRDGKQCVNTCLNVPRTSAEMDLFSEEYIKLSEAFEPIFNWVDQMVFVSAPSEYTQSDYLLDQRTSPREPPHTIAIC